MSGTHWFERVRVAQCRCGARLLVTEPDASGTFKSHHGEPHCMHYRSLVSGARSEVLDTAIVFVPAGVTITTKPGQA